MFRLRALQAKHGDCLLLEYGSSTTPAYILIDGGPGGVYEAHLRDVLIELHEAGAALELIILSHVDDDHVNGLLDLLDEIVQQRRNGETEIIGIRGLWHNSFGKTVGGAVERRLARQMGGTRLPRGEMPLVRMQERSIAQGQKLTADARGLLIPINVDFRDTPDRLVSLDNAPRPFTFANLKLHVVGPSRDMLADLQHEWEKWLAKQKKAEEKAADAQTVARELDKSVPNLSSIMLLVEGEGKTALLTGDGRGDHLLQGLEQAGFMQPGGTLHVDLFKLPHHGSSRNISAELFERITADTYVICADGRDDNPDLQTLEWLVETAMKQGRSIHIVATSDTPSIRAMRARFDPQQSGYDLTLIAPGAHDITVDLGRAAARQGENLQRVNGIGPIFAKRLALANVTSLQGLRALSATQLASLLRTGPHRAANILQAAGQ